MLKGLQAAVVILPVEGKFVQVQRDLFGSYSYWLVFNVKSNLHYLLRWKVKPLEVSEIKITYWINELLSDYSLKNVCQSIRQKYVSYLCQKQ